MHPRLSFSRLIYLLLLLLVSCGGDSDQAGRTSGEQAGQGKNVQAAPVSAPANFSAYDLSGRLRHSNEWIGKQPVVINLWGTWCSPCRREIPDLIRLYKEFRPQGVEMIGLAVKDQHRRVGQFVEQQGMEWVILMAERHHLYSLRATSGVPTTIFLDRNGNEVARFVGGRPYDIFKQAFQAIL
ncbi:MAG: TlpA family protein disulfide reductase [candidate division Zixibacteria bacterium]|nr:TlpA family protein disulfide reductase [candidate division Zixibacteria bacterium]